MACWGWNSPHSWFDLVSSFLLCSVLSTIDSNLGLDTYLLDLFGGALGLSSGKVNAMIPERKGMKMDLNLCISMNWETPQRHTPQPKKINQSINHQASKQAGRRNHI